MRVAIALGLLAGGLLTGAAAADAKPVDANSVDGRPSAQAMLYRMQGVGACIAAHPPGPTHDPQDGFVAQNCQCAVDRFIAGRDPAELPSLRDDPKLIEENFAACRAERAGTNAPAPDDLAAETDSGAKDPDAPASPGLWARLRGLDPGGWLSRSGLPTWAWAAIAVFVLLLGLALRGRQGRGHLMGPPRSMQPPPGVDPGSDGRES